MIWYRPTIVRALLSALQLLLPDEPFAALDGESVVCVARAFGADYRGGRAVVLATHVMPEGMQVVRGIQLRMDR